MDHAVALVQAYLQVNGYLTAAEVPVLTALPAGGYQSATDMDLLALRLCAAGGVTLPPGATPFTPDPALAVPKGAADFLVIEVKEGRAELNRGARDPDILRTVLEQFGLAPHDRPERAFRQLEREGRVRWPGDIWVRRLAFGSTVDPTIVHGFRAISLTHVTSFLTNFIERNWPALRHAQLRQHALGFFALLEQVRRTRGSEASAGKEEE
jgi:hypothetical protein